MLDTEQQAALNQRVRVLQIVLTAMIWGVLVFLAVAMFIPRQAVAGAHVDRPLFITYLGVACGLVACIFGPAFASIVVNTARRRIIRQAPWDDRRNAGGADGTDDAGGAGSASAGPLSAGAVDMLLNAYASKTLVCAAIYEAAALLLCVAYLVERKPASAIIAAVIAAGVLLQIPSRDQAERWLDKQARLLQLG